MKFDYTILMNRENLEVGLNKFGLLSKKYVCTRGLTEEVSSFNVEARRSMSPVVDTSVKLKRVK